MNESAGMTLIEVLVAMVIVTIGLLGMAAGTGWMIRSVDVTRLDTNRAAALQASIEAVGGLPFASVAAGSSSQGDFDVTWSVVESAPNWKALEFVIIGPGRVPGSMGPRAEIGTSVVDTLSYRINRR
jgi:prepilin-type N-terminal cleavage/methylation domain-containing protein